MSDMTVRTWSATATETGADDYSSYFAGTLLPELRKLPGFEGAYLLSRDLDGTVELTAHTFWDSPAAIRAFTGDDISVSVVEPEAQAMLLDFDRTCAPPLRRPGARSPRTSAIDGPSLGLCHQRWAIHGVGQRPMRPRNPSCPGLRCAGCVKHRQWARLLDAAA